jgi:PAS domain-containing protein
MAAVSNLTEPDEMLASPTIRCLLEAIPAALYITDNDGRIRIYNDTAAELWGRRPAPGEYWCGSWKILNDDGSEMPLDRCPMAMTVRSGEPTVGFEITVERPDGRTARVAPHPWPLLDEHGKRVGSINMLVDVTKPREVEFALLAAELERHELRQQVALQQQITRALADTSSLQAQGSESLVLACELAGAQLGCLWLLGGRSSLHLIGSHAADPKACQEYVQYCTTGNLRINEAVISTVVRSRKPVWIEDTGADPSIERLAQARACGLSSVVVYPIVLREGLPIRAAFELYFSEPRAYDELLLTTLGDFALKLGGLIERLDNEAMWAESERRLALPADEATAAVPVQVRSA